MKIEFNEPVVEKKFKPLEIKIQVETIEDARLMYQLFNEGDFHTLFRESGISIDYSITRELADLSEFKKLREYITDQGFEV